MKRIVTTGIAIGLGCSAWTCVMGITGWYLHPLMRNLFWVVVLIQIVLLAYGLRATAGSRSYSGQVGRGAAMSTVAAVIVFAGSLIFSAFLFPAEAVAGAIGTGVTGLVASLLLAASLHKQKN